jgi:WD40 repeat protein
VIIFTGSGGALRKVSEAGGTPIPLTALDRSRGEFAHAAPWFLPDGRHFLYMSLRSVGPSVDRWVCTGSLDSTETNCLLKAASSALYAPPGDILYLSGQTLMAQPFDAQHLRITGDAVPIANPVQAASVSANGILTYIGAESGETVLQWFDRSGKNLGTVGQPADYSNPALSPDGARVAVAILSNGAGIRNLWIFDLKRGIPSRFTFDTADEFNPLWSRDGSQILFTSAQQGVRDIYQKAADGVGDSHVVFESKDQQKNANDWSSDGRYAVYGTTAAPASLWILPLFGDRKPFPFIQSTYNAREARFSPDGRYIAYASDETGDYEIYVQTFPEHGGKWQISTSEGRNPEWRRDGKELYFVSGEKLMAVDVKTGGPQFEAGIPKPLFAVPFGSGIAVNPNAVYTVTADGQRFLAVTSIRQQASSPITVVTNWTADLKP